MSINLTVFGLAGFGFLAAALAGGLLGLHLKYRVPGLGFRDGMRAVVYAAEVAGVRRVPSWSRGTVWLAAAAAVGAFALLVSSSAFLGAVESAAAPGATATWSSAFITMTGTSTQSGPASFTLELPFLTLALLLVPFALGSRIWRLWTGQRAHRASVDAY